ncbi:hypothetical protein C6B37_01745 [Candidatus Phytoplasma phoenicium]|uniref:Uncharacterized protein n=1 Tax=Candidatus Phytoplasma phoenicium TaxID=198422 RepID=A0A2S8NU37_9MOLU|nr:hypothetical protein C6B37_01745 [Candidatus Phytoplasma phoenicium]
MKKQIKKLTKQITKLNKHFTILKEKYYNVNNQSNFKKELILVELLINLKNIDLFMLLMGQD